MRVTSSLGLATGALLMAATGCSFEASVGGSSLDQADVERVITEGLTEQVGVAPQDVDCEGVSDIDVEEGSTFTCTGTAPNDETFDINLTLTDDEGTFNYEVP